MSFLVLLKVETRKTCFYLKWNKNDFVKIILNYIFINISSDKINQIWYWSIRISVKFEFCRYLLPTYSYWIYRAPLFEYFAFSQVISNGLNINRPQISMVFSHHFFKVKNEKKTATIIQSVPRHYHNINIVEADQMTYHAKWIEENFKHFSCFHPISKLVYTFCFYLGLRYG